MTFKGSGLSRTLFFFPCSLPKYPKIPHLTPDIQFHTQTKKL